MPGRPPPAVAAAVLVAVEVAAVAVLHALGGQGWARLPPWGGWWEVSAPVDLLLALLRLGALALAWWSLGASVLYLFGRLAGLRGATRALAAVQVPVVCRVLDRAVAGSLVLAAAATPVPAVAGPAAPLVAVTAPPELGPPVRADDGSAPPGDWKLAQPPELDRQRTGPRADDVPGTRPPGLDPPAPTPTLTESAGAARRPRVAPPGSATGGAPPPGRSEGDDATTDRRHVVAPGEHLWSIARTHLAASTARRPDALEAAEIAGYWRRLVATNRTRLSSGDPDLIFPGEHVRLPPVSAAGDR